MSAPSRICIVFVLAIALAGCGVLDSLQRELIFRPVTQEWSGYGPGIVAHEELWIPVGDRGERLHAWWVPAQSRVPVQPIQPQPIQAQPIEPPPIQPQPIQARDAPAMLFLHGARVNLSGSVYRIRGYARMGFNVLAIDYRGFGRSSERLPSETSVTEDARAAWDWLATRVPDARRRVIYGHSLGGAIGAALAAEVGPAGALVLESTFTSIRDMAERSAFGFLPLDLLLTQRFEVHEMIARVQMPVLIVQGGNDTIVPPEMAQELYASAPGPKRLLIAEGVGHRWVIRRVGAELERTLRSWTCDSASTTIRHC